KHLHDVNLQTRREILLALASIGPDAKAAVPELLKMVQTERGPPRVGAVYALTKIGADEVIPLLKQLVDTQDDPMLSLACAWALVLFEPQNEEHARVAVPPLTKALANE